MPWMMPTYGRPELAQRCLDACAETNMSEPGLLYVRERFPGEYDGLRAGPNWTRIDSGMEMADTMRHCFRENPDAPYYGWISDDMLPRTERWDVELVRAASRTNLADCADLFFSHDLGLRAYSLTSAFCWGGDLVRAVGWWALPGVRQAGIDDAWVFLICRHFPRLRVHLENVVVEHVSWKNKKRPRDETDGWIRDGVAYVHADLERMDRWRQSEDATETLMRIHALVG